MFVKRIILSCRLQCVSVSRIRWSNSGRTGEDERKTVGKVRENCRKGERETVRKVREK